MRMAKILTQLALGFSFTTVLSCLLINPNRPWYEWPSALVAGVLFLWATLCLLARIAERRP